MKWLIRKFFKPFAYKMLQVVLEELADVAVVAVKQLSQLETLTNEEKRKKAFEVIKTEAIMRGKELKDSAINLAIELAVQLVK